VAAEKEREPPSSSSSSPTELGEEGGKEEKASVVDAIWLSEAATPFPGWPRSPPPPPPPPPPPLQASLTRPPPPMREKREGECFSLFSQSAPAAPVRSPTVILLKAGSDAQEGGGRGIVVVGAVEMGWGEQEKEKY